MADEKFVNIEVSEDTLSVALMDGLDHWRAARLVSAVAECSSEAQRENWRISGGGYGIHWPDVEENLSTEGLLHGAPASHRTLAEE